LAIGVKQTKDRTVKGIQIIVLPTMMILLSLFGTFSAFGFWNINAFTFWLIGIATSGVFSSIVQSPKCVTYSSAQKTYNLPGSWWPLSLMMTIFFIKYAVGVISARKLPVLDEQEFISLISLSYGFLSGIFLFRASVIWRAKNNRLKVIG
jgi:hypothetical protein